jgi:hypothetical protein
MESTSLTDWIYTQMGCSILTQDITKTWNPLLWWTIYTQMGCSILTQDITKTWNPLLWQQSAFRDWPAHCILDEVNSLWIGWNCVLTSDLYIYICKGYLYRSEVCYQTASDWLATMIRRGGGMLGFRV